MATSTATKEIQELKNEVKHLQELVEESVNDNAGTGVHFDRAELRRMARKTGRNVRGYLSQKRAQAVELRDMTEDQVVRHPFISVATAVAGGLILGSLLKRK